MAAAEYLRCVTVMGDDTDLIVLLLHNTKDIELNTAKLFYRTKKYIVKSLFLLHETHSEFLLGVWMQHNFQDIYEGQKSSSESLKLTQNIGGQLLCLRTVMCLKQSKLLLLSPQRPSLQPFMQQI